MSYLILSSKKQFNKWFLKAILKLDKIENHYAGGGQYFYMCLHFPFRLWKKNKLWDSRSKGPLCGDSSKTGKGRTRLGLLFHFYHTAWDPTSPSVWIKCLGEEGCTSEVLTIGNNIARATLTRGTFSLDSSWLESSLVTLSFSSRPPLSTLAPQNAHFEVISLSWFYPCILKKIMTVLNCIFVKTWLI